MANNMDPTPRGTKTARRNKRGIGKMMSKMAFGSFGIATVKRDTMHIGRAASETWTQWVQQTEQNGHPARATAVLWAELVRAEGGGLPEGVADSLGLEP